MRLLASLAVSAFIAIAGTASPAAAADISVVAAKGLPHLDPCVHSPKHGHLFFHKLFKSKCLPSEMRGGGDGFKSKAKAPKVEEPKCEKHCGPKGKKFGKGKWGDGPGHGFKKKRGKEIVSPPPKKKRGFVSSPSPKKERGFGSGGKKQKEVVVFGGSKQKKGPSARGGGRDKSPPTYATPQKKSAKGGGRGGQTSSQ